MSTFRTESWRRSKQELWDDAVSVLAAACAPRGLSIDGASRSFSVRGHRFLLLGGARCCIIPIGTAQRQKHRRYLYAWVCESGLRAVSAVCFVFVPRKGEGRVFIVPPEPLRDLLGDSRECMQVVIPLHEARRYRRRHGIAWRDYEDTWELIGSRH